MFYSVVTNQEWLKNIDMGSLTWFTDYFGEPQRQYVNNLFNYYMTFSAEIGDVKGVVLISIIITIILFIKQEAFSGLVRDIFGFRRHHEQIN